MELKPDRTVLLDIVNTKMPYGKYKGRSLADIPVYYINWCIQKDALPKGRLGELLMTVLEIKSNDLNFILKEIKSWRR